MKFSGCPQRAPRWGAALVALGTASGCHGSDHASHRTVVAYHVESANAARGVLDAGGNAFDAFIAATLVDDVVGYGVSTPAGQLGAMLYVAGDGTKIYLDAGYNDVAAGTSWMSGDPAGTTFVVPGEIAGLAQLSAKYGRLSLADAVQPAIDVATNGFVIDPDYAYAITANAATLQGQGLKDSGGYGSALFFPNGSPLVAGDLLVQPQLAQFLSNVAAQGAAYVTTGDWAQDCVAAVDAEGGALTTADLSGYQAQWLSPWTASYHGRQIFTSSGRTFGGVEELAALQTIASVIGNVAAPVSTTAVDGTPFTTYTPDVFEVLVRTWRAVIAAGCGTPWSSYALLDNASAVEACLTAQYGAGVWSTVDSQLSASAVATVAPHTFSIAIVDADGNAIAGTHTIEGGNWGVGIFVDGVVLNASAEIPFQTNAPDAAGQRRRITPLPMHLVFDGSQLTLALATFGESEEEVGFEFLVDALDFQLPLAEALAMPRFGFTTTSDGETVNSLDWGVPASTVSTLQARGLDFSQATSADDPVDTGLGVAIEIGSNGVATGAAAPLRGAPCPSCDAPTVLSW
jgi:gamma-glutamyltranspeptidase / glutathione hydrolase